MPDSNPNLRRELHRLAGGDSSAAVRHPQLIAELRESMPHSVRPAPPDLPPDLPLDQYNCFEFALGLAGDPNVVRIRSIFRETSCNTNFADYLLNTSALTTIPAPLPGDLVLYRNAECFAHAGVVQPKSIISKWGISGHVWIHDLWDVPTIYGDAVDFYRFADSAGLSQRFVEFARERRPWSFGSRFGQPTPTRSSRASISRFSTSPRGAMRKPARWHRRSCA